MGELEILLTNDDGIDSVGIRALYDALSELADVTVVAPAEDKSAIGRAISHEVEVFDHELGYAVAGTPADCVVAGLTALGSTPDIVVAGCNKGANLGEYVLGRSGTVSAAVEAAFFDLPAIATSLYVPVGDIAFEDRATTADEYNEAVRATTYLVDHGLEAGVFEYANYLNVNAPVPGAEPAPIEITRPSTRYEMDAERNGEGLVIHDRIWEQMDPDVIPDPDGTDRRAVAEGRVSVSPLTAPHSVVETETLTRLLEAYPSPIDA